MYTLSIAYLTSTDQFQCHLQWDDDVAIFTVFNITSLITIMKNLGIQNLGNIKFNRSNIPENIQAQILQLIAEIQ